MCKVVLLNSTDLSVHPGMCQGQQLLHTAFRWIKPNGSLHCIVGASVLMTLPCHNQNDSNVFADKTKILFSFTTCFYCLTFDSYIRAQSSVTRLGDLLDFGPLFKAFGGFNFHILGQFLVEMSNSIIFQSNHFLSNLYRHLAIFWSHWHRV